MDDRPDLTSRALRVLLTSAHRLRRRLWSVTRPKTYGAHAAAITPAGRIVLVRLRYAPGWRLPGGGRKAHEDPQQAVLRELREEIGMIAHGPIQRVCDLDEAPDFKRDTASLFIVRGVVYRPRWSIEVEAIAEADIDDLPPGTSARTRRWLQALRPALAER